MEFHIRVGKDDRFITWKTGCPEFYAFENKYYSTKIIFVMGIADLFTVHLMTYAALLV